MSLAVPPYSTRPPLNTDELYRLSVDQYHSLISNSALTEDDPVELVDGLLVLKFPKNPLHEAIIAIVLDLLMSNLPTGWSRRAQGSITLENSEPEPDVAVFRGTHRDYTTRHLGPADLALVLEVADSSLHRDRTDELAIYGRANIPTYIILNLTTQTLELHTQPDPQSSRYRTLQTLSASDTLTLHLPDTAPISLPASALLP